MPARKRCPNSFWNGESGVFSTVERNKFSMSKENSSDDSLRKSGPMACSKCIDVYMVSRILLWRYSSSAEPSVVFPPYGGCVGGSPDGH